MHTPITDLRLREVKAASGQFTIIFSVSACCINPRSACMCTRAVYSPPRMSRKHGFHTRPTLSVSS